MHISASTGAYRDSVPPNFRAYRNSLLTVLTVRKSPLKKLSQTDLRAPEASQQQRDCACRAAHGRAGPVPVCAATRSPSARGWELLGPPGAQSSPAPAGSAAPHPTELCRRRAARQQRPSAIQQLPAVLPHPLSHITARQTARHPKPKESPKAMGQSPRAGPGTAAPQAHGAPLCPAARPRRGLAACGAKKPNAHRQCLLPAQRCNQHLPHQHRTVSKPNPFNKQLSCTSLSLKDRWVSPIRSYSEHKLQTLMPAKMMEPSCSGH